MSDENIKLLKSVGLKVTEPRLTILALMQETREQMQHFSAEDIYKLLLEKESDIGLATVYRVLNQFEEAGILVRHNFDANKALEDGGNFFSSLWQAIVNFFKSFGA